MLETAGRHGVVDLFGRKSLREPRARGDPGFVGRIWLLVLGWRPRGRRDGARQLERGRCGVAEIRRSSCDDQEFSGTSFCFNSEQRTQERLSGEVAWQGKLAAPMPLKGVEITWAHAPEEIRVLTSPNGSNFEEAICFRPTGKVSRF